MLFSPVLERFNLAVPFLAFLALGLHAIFGVSTAPRSDTWPYLIAAIVGSGHTVLTFLFLSFWPQGRDLARVVFRRSKVKLVITTVILAGILFYFVATAFFPGESKVYDALAVIFLALFAQHALGQMRGLSLLYNHHIRSGAKFSEPEKARFSKIEAWERRLFFLLTLVWIAEVFEQTYFDGIWTAVLNPIMLGIVLTIVVLALILPGSSLTNKPIFLLRLFLFPFATTLPEAAFALFFIHGLEYELTLFKILNFGEKKIATGLWVFSLGFLFIGFPLFHHAAMFFSHLNPSLILSLAVIGKSVDYFHYYIDALIFKFKDPEIRARLLPALISSESSGPSDNRRTPFGDPTGS